MTNMFPYRDGDLSESANIQLLRRDVQKLYYLKKFARYSDTHVGVFTHISKKTIDEALSQNATFIMGGPLLNDIIQQNDWYYKRFNKSPYVDLYDSKGNSNVLIGLIGHIGDTQIIIHPIGQYWVHPIVAHDFKDYDLVYACPRPGVMFDAIQLTERLAEITYEAEMAAVPRPYPKGSVIYWAGAYAELLEDNGCTLIVRLNGEDVTWSWSRDGENCRLIDLPK